MPGFASSPGIGFIIAAAVEMVIVVDGVGAILKLTAAISAIEHPRKQMLFLSFLFKASALGFSD